MGARRPRNRELLRRTAQRFEPKPTRDPWYVQTPMEPGQAPGWWWQPAGAAEPVYLGANVYMAELALHLALREVRAA